MSVQSVVVSNHGEPLTTENLNLSSLKTSNFTREQKAQEAQFFYAFNDRDSVFFNDDTAKFEISGQDPDSHAFVICEHK